MGDSTVATRVREHVRAVLVAIAYAVLANVGYAFYYPGTEIATFWPASGLLLAALLRARYGAWIPTLAYVTVAHLFADTVVHDVPVAVSLGFTLADTLEASVGAVLLRRFVAERFALDRLEQAVGLAVVMGLVATPLSAVIGATAEVYGLGQTNFARLMKTWWLGDALGTLLVAPAIITFPKLDEIAGAQRARFIEAAVLLVATLVTAQATFGARAISSGELGFPYLVVPLLLWAAIRFGTSGASLLSVLITTTAIWNARYGRGPFVNVGTTAYDHALALQSFVAVTYSAQIVAALHMQNVHALDALASSAAMYTSLARAVPVAIFRTDDEGRIVYVNARFTELTGLDATLSAGTPWRDFVHRDDVDALPAKPDSSQGAGGLHDFRVVHTDGRVSFVLSALVVEHDAQGTRTGFVGTLADVTDRRHADQARKALEAALLQSQKMEAVGRLAGGVAHDFNNVLTAILGYAFVVGERLDAASPLRGYVEQISIAGKRAASLTHQLLAFSRKQVLEPKVIDVNVVVRETLEMLRRLVSEEITMKTELDEGIGAVRVDPNQLVQVLMNLAVNARDAMDGTAGTLTIETRSAQKIIAPSHDAAESLESPHGFAVITVRDTGVGMDEETQRHLFEPFFTTKLEGKGTGLGLATVHGIVHQSGGVITCSSRLGLGTSFDVYLPCVAEPATNERPLSLAPPSLRARGGTILLVEDDDDVRSLERHVLESAGYQVLTARHAEEAEGLSHNFGGHIGLLVTDVVMPRVAGPELARRLSASRPGLRVLYVSGYSDHPSLHGALSPTERFLAKPFTPNALLSLVDEHIG